METDYVTVQVTLDSDSCTYAFYAPQSHVESILKFHSFVAQHGNPSIEIRTVKDEDKR